MTPEQFNLIKESAIKKWGEPGNIKDIKKAGVWFWKVGNRYCSYCKNFDCDECPANRTNGCFPEFEYLYKMFNSEIPKPTLERFHKKTAILLHKVKKARYLKRYKNITFIKEE